MNTAKKMAKTTTILMVITLISKVFGFVRETVIARYFGAGMETDAYFMALSIPNLIFASIGASISTTFIPLYTQLLTSDGRSTANRFANNLLNIISIICCFLLILGIIFSPNLVNLLAPGFSDEIYDLTVDITRILFIGAIFSMVSSVLTGILQSNERFLGPALVGFPYNIAIIIGCILFAKNYGIYALTIATLIGTMGQALIQVFFVKGKYSYETVLDFKDPYVKKLAILIIPVLMGTAIGQINTIVDKALASSLVQGSISSINYSNRLIGFVQGIFIGSVTTVVYPFFSQLCAKENYRELNQYISGSINIFTMIMIPITIITLIYSKEIVSIVFERGEFSKESVNLTAYALKFLSLGLLPFAVRQVFNRAFYALQDTRTPMINGAIAVVINIIADILLVKHLEVGGLTLATSLSFFASVIFFIMAWKRTMHCGIRDILDFKGLGKLILSGIPFFIIIWLLSVKGIHFFLAIILSGIAYIVILWLFRVKELKIVTSYISNRFLKRDA